MQTDSSDTDMAQRQSPGYLLSVYAMEERELKLADLWQVIYDGKWIILLTALMCAIVAAIVALLMTPVYRAEVLMTPVVEDDRAQGFAALAGQLGGLASIAGFPLNNTGGGTAQALATLKSRLLTEQFIRDRNLVPVLIDNEVNPASEADRDTGDRRIIWEAYRQFDSLRGVSEDLETGLVTLTIDWLDADQAAAWANDLVAEVNRYLRTKAIEEAEANLEFLQGELEKYSAVEVRNAVFSLMEAEMKNAMLANVRAQYAFEVIDPAVPPEQRFKPRRTLMVIVAFSGGLFLGFIFVILRHAVRGPTSVRSSV